MHHTQSTKENFSEHQSPRQSSRSHKASRRLTDATNNAKAATHEKQIKKKAALLRAKKRTFAKNTQTVVDRPGDSEEIRQLKGMAALYFI